MTRATTVVRTLSCERRRRMDRGPQQRPRSSLYLSTRLLAAAFDENFETAVHQAEQGPDD